MKLTEQKGIVCANVWQSTWVLGIPISSFFPFSEMQTHPCGTRTIYTGAGTQELTVAGAAPREASPAAKRGRSDIEMNEHHIMTFHFCLSRRIAPPDHYLCLILIFQSSIINKERKPKIVPEAQRPRLQNKNAANTKRGPKAGEL